MQTAHCEKVFNQASCKTKIEVYEIIILLVRTFLPTFVVKSFLPVNHFTGNKIGRSNANENDHPVAWAFKFGMITW